MSAEVTLTEDEREALDIAVIDDRDRQEGYAVLGPGGTDGQTPTLHEAVERIVAARVEQARADEREQIAQVFMALHEEGFDTLGIEDAARIAREGDPS